MEDLFSFVFYWSDSLYFFLFFLSFCLNKCVGVYKAHTWCMRVRLSPSQSILNANETYCLVLEFIRITLKKKTVVVPFLFPFVVSSRTHNAVFWVCVFFSRSIPLVFVWTMRSVFAPEFINRLSDITRIRHNRLYPIYRI